MKIAIQGEIGSFHDAAARQWFGSDIDLVAADTFSQAFTSLDKGEADALVVAIENSIHGSIPQVYDLIELHGHPVIGEVPMRVHQNLISLPGATPSDITHIYSHPVALSQCSDYLDKHFPDAERIEHPDTAGAVRHIKEAQDESAAAIGSTRAAEVYQLPVMASGIENDDQNFTRFLVINPEAGVSSGANASMISLVTNHQPGSLAQALSLFAEHDINLLKLQSRPIVGSPWRYKFYIDVACSGEQLDILVEQIRQHGNDLAVLGEYRLAN